MNRALRAATTGVLLLSPIALSACSAGQVTQTATQQRDKVGAMAEVGDLTLRAITLAYPEDGIYEAGDDATLQLAIVNTGIEDDTLTGVSGEGFDEAVLSPAGASPSTGPSRPDTGTGTSSDGTGTAAGADEVEIPAGTAVFFGEGGGTITLAGLDEPLTPGQALELTLTFENAGEVTTRAVVTTPEEEVERGESFDFHHEEEAGTGEESPQEQVEVSGGTSN
ncbi:copper chaperone PCu(A)C [Blastococcus xanthinilyticus]|uniref:Copper(I)-binding protein n=1 Tax=Blastococcus xanthinilyticus TaxID=1564164 RepID=A0A5S5CP40_9ACTN|nr:copper chaperone PCu(A)C [Blastococcus xanthinilyticus]TYP84812.1 copper(I)-binding protein [Blastococcus xanthinilyticus]